MIRFSDGAICVGIDKSNFTEVVWSATRESCLLWFLVRMIEELRTGSIDKSLKGFCHKGESSKSTSRGKWLFFRMVKCLCANGSEPGKKGGKEL